MTLSEQADIYFSEHYGKLYERAENGKAVVWCYRGAEGEVVHQFIRREIPLSLAGGPWYDIVTPYGYGGPLMTQIAPGYTAADLEQAFTQAFADYCNREKIVSEFVRFHPMLENGPAFRRVYHATCIRHTLGTDLTVADPVGTEFSKECRRRVRKALDAGVTWRITQAPDSLEAFREIYYATMDRNHAGEYYYFDGDYFADCLRYFKQNVLFVQALLGEKTIAAGLYFIFDKTIHVHLSGTLSEYLYLSPAYVLRYAAALWGKENGYERIHHGGGRSNASDDTLYAFKKHFAKNVTFDFYVGKRIWNEEVYGALCRLTNTSLQEEYFPAYRMKMKG